MSRFAVLLLAALMACSTSDAGDAGAQAVATVYPLAWIVGEVAPDLEVDSLAARGQEPHDLELSPSQRAVVERAPLLVYLGDIGFQPQVEDAIAGASGEAVSAAEVIGDDALLRTDDGGQIDPHLWFDPSLLVDVATQIGEAAARAFPDRAQEYRDNAERVARQLDELAQEVDRLLERCRHDEVVVSHEAYAYLLTPHGLTQSGISGAGADSEASPQDIRALSARVREEGLPAVLSERIEGRSDATAVAREAGVELIEISALDIVTQEQAARGFPALLLAQAQAVATAAGCGAAS